MKIIEFFKKIKPSRRKLIQLYAALLTNANAKGFISGRIYTGASKSVCVPGMNCYSCPGAVGACPLGSLQNALASQDKSNLFYVVGIILLFAITLGRTICGWLCPAGLIQELFYKIKTPKLKKNKVTRVLSYFKYFLLLAFVIILPLMYSSQTNALVVPAFCKYICPIGTFEGAIGLLANSNNAAMYAQLGPLFTWKMSLMIIIFTASIFIYRFFCRFLCPLGALYGLFNRISILGIKVDQSKCTHCSACVSNCKMDVKYVGDQECIQCGECIQQCHVHAIDWKLIKKQVHADLHPEENLAVAAAPASAPAPVKEEIVVEETVKNNKVVDATPIEQPKTKVLNKQLQQNEKKVPLTKIIISSIMAAVLVFAVIFYNFIDVKTTVEIGSKLATNTKISLVDGSSKTLDQGRASYLYFYTTYSEEDYVSLSQYAQKMSDLDVYFISNYTNYEENKAKLPTNSDKPNLYFAYDGSDMSLYHTFTTMKYDTYSLVMDTENSVFVSQSGILNTKSFDAIVVEKLEGGTIGYEIGNICPSVDLEYINEDKKFNIIDYRGNVVVLNFWYIDCGPCKLELPGFSELQKTYPDDVKVVAIHDSSQYGKQDVINFLANDASVAPNGELFRDLAVDYLYDSTPSYYEALGGDSSWPMTLVLDRTGKVSFSKHGSLEKTDLFTAVETAMAA